MSGTTQHTCPGCGAVLDDTKSKALCPACLMSGVLRAEPETMPLHEDGGGVPGETLTVVPGASSRAGRARIESELPREFGGYTLVALLGRGGMGTVYEAVQRSTGRRLALKLLDRSLDSPEMRRRFLREGRLAARINHPASLYVFGSEEIDGIPTITMEIAAAGTLQDALDRRGPLPVREAVDAVLNMIDGLEAAHSRGVLHRDIKPSNCFVAPDGTVMVGDFGLSVSTLPTADTFITQTGRVMGTPAFASPEQLRGDTVDVRSDIYSVGATLFALLTARAAFEGDNAVQVVANVIDTPPAAVSRFRDDLPPGLEQVITRCLSKEPGGRYAGYSALRDALLPFSSVVPDPATQAQRTAAGWIDFLAAFLPAYAAVMLTAGPVALFIRPLYEFSFAAWSYHLLVLGTGFLYFAVAEGVWGAGLGKWIMNLRVAGAGGRAPGVGRALLRIAMPIAVIESVRVPLSIATLPEGEWAPVNMLVFIGLSILCPWIVALLWLPARRGNGFATVWDLASASRVVVRPRGRQRPVLADAAEEVAANKPTPEPRPETPPETQPETQPEPDQSLGPFRVGNAIVPGRWLAGDDPVLRRRVWLIRRVGTPPSEARRAAARPGRPRWLQEIASDSETWDAYEAPRGTPLTDRVADGPVAWSTLRFWLHDLAAELRAAERDGTLPHACSLDNVWITPDGHAVLLDTAWPGADRSRHTGSEPIAVDTLTGQQRFLGAVAGHTDPLSVPLHAQSALHNLRAGSYEKLTFLAGTLRGLLSKPADVSRGLRAASLFVIPGYAWVATLLGIASNTDPSVGPAVWLGRAAIAGLVMLNIIAVCDVVLAFWRKSTTLSTFGLEAVTEHGRASRARLLLRSAIVWLPVLVPTGVLIADALAGGVWIGFESAAVLGAITLGSAGVFAAIAIVRPTRGVHDRLAGTWIGRR